jgi:Flp pilus assembly protein TadD
MKKEQAVARKQIKDAWFNYPVYTCELCEHYLDEFPDDGYIWALYGEALTRRARFDDARRALDTANGLLIDDGYKAVVYGFRGHLLTHLGDYASAEQWYRHAADLAPTNGGWQLYIGVTLRHQKRNHEAEACYRKALTLEGERDEFLLNLGYVLQARGDFEGAAQCHRDALTIDPQYTLAKEALEDVLKAIEFRRLRGNRD